MLWIIVRTRVTDGGVLYQALFNVVVKVRQCMCWADAGEIPMNFDFVLETGVVLITT